MPPEKGSHWVRGHYRRNPRPSGKKTSGWVIAAAVAGIWLWGHFIGFGAANASSTSPSTPAPAVSAAAGR